MDACVAVAFRLLTIAVLCCLVGIVGSAAEAAVVRPPRQRQGRDIKTNLPWWWSVSSTSEERKHVHAHAHQATHRGFRFPRSTHTAVLHVGASTALITLLTETRISGTAAHRPPPALGVFLLGLLHSQQFTTPEGSQFTLAEQIVGYFRKKVIPACTPRLRLSSIDGWCMASVVGPGQSFRGCSVSFHNLSSMVRWKTFHVRYVAVASHAAGSPFTSCRADERTAPYSRARARHAKDDCVAALLQNT